MKHIFQLRPKDSNYSRVEQIYLSFSEFGRVQPGVLVGPIEILGLIPNFRKPGGRVVQIPPLLFNIKQREILWGLRNTKLFLSQIPSDFVVEE